MDLGFAEYISNMVNNLIEFIKIILYSFMFPFITALIFHYFIEWLKRPKIEINEDEDKYDPKFDVHYLHVRVVNKKGKLVNRNPAYDCEPEVYVVNAENDEVKVGSPYSTKWARQTTIVLDPNTKRPIYAPP